MARGNPAMRAKRVTGPTPNTVLNTVVACTTCSTPGCGNAPLITNPQAGNVKRLCRQCWKAPLRKRAEVGRSWREPWLDEYKPSPGWRNKDAR